MQLFLRLRARNLLVLSHNMADLEPWTYPMIQYYRGKIEPYKFYATKGARNDEDIPMTDMKKLFPWAVDKAADSASSSAASGSAASTHSIEAPRT